MNRERERNESGMTMRQEAERIVQAALAAAMPDAAVHRALAKLPPCAGRLVLVAAGKAAWRCTVCGYIYEGEELPSDFICPLCKHGAADFEPIS